MASPKVRYEPQSGEQAEDIQFSDEDLEILRCIKDDEFFIENIRHISMLYGTLKRSKPDELSTGEIRVTLEDLERKTKGLIKSLDSLPQEVDLALWKFSYGKDAPGRMDNLKILLRSLARESEDALDDLQGKAGRKPDTANWYAAAALKTCFTAFGLLISVNSWEDSQESPIVACLRLIFEIHGTRLSRSGIEEYLK